jgi:sugar phosphate isomerase/epimerase
MHTAICHYSYNRTWTNEKWSCEDLVKAVKAQGVEGIDFHAELLGDRGTAVRRITTALKGSGITLAGLSLSNDFNTGDADELQRQVESAVQWVRVAGELKAPVSRIFGGNLGDRADKRAVDAALRRITDALGTVVKEAAKHGVVLALENHGGMPCTGEEQVKVIESIGSPFLRATVDVGNYMACGQEGHVGTALAARYAAYVHLKDFKRIRAGSGGAAVRGPFGSLEACTLGAGEVDQEKCLRALKAAGYKGFVALEFEAEGDERKGVSDSAAFMNTLMQRLA